MEKLIDKSCAAFAQELASKAPVPGGGGAAALAGALGTALCSMVGNLTVGRKKYAQFEPDILRILERAEKIRVRLLELVDEDAQMFEPLQKAYSMPKDAPDRAAVMEKVSLDACAAPLEMMRMCAEAVDLLEETAEKGSVMLVSDVGCGALLCGAAIEAASMNIFINTKPLNCARAREIEAEADSIRESAGGKASRVAGEVMQRLHRDAVN